MYFYQVTLPKINKCCNKCVAYGSY